MDKLGQDQRDAVLSVLDEADALLKKSCAEGGNELSSKANTSLSQKKTSEKKKKKKKTLGDVLDQPKAGIKSNSKGPVTWKFGAYLCHGTLLPSKETKTHCYARTQKGNIKTLKKTQDL